MLVRAVQVGPSQFGSLLVDAGVGGELAIDFSSGIPSGRQVVEGEDVGL